jgi:hypothetical protein
MHTEPWSPAIGLATNAIRYWDVRIKHKGDRNPMAGVLNYYLSLSYVEADAHDKLLSVEECIKQINQARQKLKYVVANAKEHRTQFEVELATAIVEHKHPYLCDGNDYDLVDKDNLVAKVLKTRENRKTAKRSWKKLGRQIREIIKPETLKRSRLTKIEVPDGDEWKKVEDKEIIVKLLPLPQPQLRAHTYAQTNPSAQRASEHLKNVECFNCGKKGHYSTDCSLPKINDNEQSNMVSKSDFKNLFQSSMKEMLTKKDKQAKKNTEGDDDSLDMNVFEKLMEGKHIMIVTKSNDDLISINDTDTFDYSMQDKITHKDCEHNNYNDDYDELAYPFSKRIKLKHEPEEAQENVPVQYTADIIVEIKNRDGTVVPMRALLDTATTATIILR